MVVATHQSVGWLASRTCCHHTQTSCKTEGQDARCGATDVLEIDQKREVFLKAYYWEITMLNSNFLVERLCGSARALPCEFVFLAKSACQDRKANSHALSFNVAVRAETVRGEF